MNLKQFITEEAPKRCGVHPSNGRIALMVFEAELNGEEKFNQDLFSTARERAAMGLPYKPKNEKEYERCLDILTLCIINHREKQHGESMAYKEEVDEIFSRIELTNEEREMVEVSWWNT